MVLIFCSDRCGGGAKYQGLPHYCCAGTGTISITGADMLKKMAGEWKLTYSNGHRDDYVISENGKLKRCALAKTLHINGTEYERTSKISLDQERNVI